MLRVAASLFRKIPKAVYRFSSKYNSEFKDHVCYTSTIDSMNKTQEIPIFRLIDLDGKLIDGAVPSIDPNTLNRIYQIMIYTEVMDDMLLKAKGQGKISFYMTSFGETATTVGVGAGLDSIDLIFPQYREQGTFLWRGYTLREIVNQCRGNSHDAAKGRQMPVHYGSPKLNMVTISSPLTTQVPQASGAGYAFRTAGDNRIAATYFGEGAASEGDFHSALNFAATLRCQTLFMCRNNHYAISTHYKEQFKTDGVAPRALGYGIHTLRVDGNDALAVYEAVKYARKFIVEKREPFFIEFLTYRLGDHSTSDNSNLYRELTEKEQWSIKNNPIRRLSSYLKHHGINQLKDEESFRAKVRQEVIDVLRESGNVKLPSINDLFSDVYNELTPNLREQQSKLNEHIEQYRDKYNIEQFDSTR